MTTRPTTAASDVPAEVLRSWQSVTDIAARTLGVPAGLIMRIDGDHIEVLVASQTAGNPYQPGAREHLAGSGLYCEHVINTRRMLLIANALDDPEWNSNPDIKLGMISYLGLPIFMPDGRIFGTLCVLDAKANAYSALYQELMCELRKIIERDLEMLQLNRELTAKNTQLAAYVSEIRTLRGIIPICGFCKKIRDDAGYWQAVEMYVTHHSHASFSHSVCPECRKVHYSEFCTAAEADAV